MMVLELKTALTKEMIDDCFEDESERAREYIKLIIDEANKQGITDINQLAYILATAKHESQSFNDFDENYNDNAYDYFENKYGYKTNKGKELGNNKPDEVEDWSS
jgi:predicted chitinase